MNPSNFLQSIYLNKAHKNTAQFREYTEEERERSLQATLAQLDQVKDIWIFGYASLIWKPEFDYVQERNATLMGYQRSLCLWSSINRGTPEKPGLVFGLERGGTCQGKVYLLSNDGLLDKMRQLWKREMPSGSYIPTWVDCLTDQGTVKALAFIMDPNDSAYAGDLTQEEMIEVILNTHGICGPCVDYVLQTHNTLQKFNIQDTQLAQLSQELLNRTRNKP